MSKPVRNKGVRHAVVFSVLAVFTLMTCASPPVTRAFAAWLLSFASRRLGLCWSRAQIVTMSGFATLAVCRTRWDFASLTLSWVAALGFALAASFARRHPLMRDPSRLRAIVARVKSELRTHATVYLALAPALIPLGVPSAVSILCNLIFAPVMGFALFPASVLGFVGLAQLANEAWSLALWCVSHAAALTPAPWSAVEISPLALVPYIVSLTAVLILRRHATLKPLRALTLTVAITALFATPARADELIVWNIGQGSWATLKSPGLCEHFDMGGEWAPKKAIAHACMNARNEVYFSHWDWDHIGLTQTARKILPGLCVQALPGGEAPNEHKAQLIAGLERCPSPASAHEIFLSRVANTSKLHGANDFSQVFIQDKIIFPGDSPSKDEKLWRARAIDARILIAGHHGSKTSTSHALLDTLTHLREIVASAHKVRYGHPHPSMLARARKHLLPVLTTEDWGSIHFQIKNAVSGEAQPPETTRKEFRMTAPPASPFQARGDDKNRATR